MAYFPMFIELKNANCLIVGGGNVALRKVLVLLDFEARVELIADKISDAIIDISKENSNLSIENRAFEDNDLKGRDLVVVATNDEKLNSRIADLCKNYRIPVNVVDDKEKCSFIFPSYVKEKNLVAAFSSGGNSPVITQYLKENEKDLLTPELGEINELLGQLREKIIKQIPVEADRKAVFKDLLKYALSCESVPSIEELEKQLMN